MIAGVLRHDSVDAFPEWHPASAGKPSKYMQPDVLRAR